MINRCKHTLVKLVVIVTVAALAACGGGSNGPKTTPTPTPDTTPNSFTFTAQTDQPVSTQVESNVVTIAGINQSVPVSVAGGEYSVAGGDFTSANGTIRSGQTLALRGTSSSEFETETTVTVTVSSVSQSFSITTLAQDITPNDFDLGIVTNAALGREVLSAGVPVRGITGAVPVSIVGGIYTIDGGTPTSSAGSIEAEQEIQVQVQASANFGTEVVATLTIGDVVESFSATTLAEDTDPDAFDLGTAALVSVPGTVVESTPVAIAGINSPASIAISNGEYRIVGEGDYTSSPSTIALGQGVQVRVTAPSQINQTATATLTIGNKSDTFAVSAQDIQAPVAEVIFPTPNTMSDGSTVTLRGKANDDFGPVTQINVVVTTDDGAVEVANETITAGAGEDYQDTWSVNVALSSEKLNTIVVRAIDAGGNIQETPVTVTVLQKAGALTTNFPAGNSPGMGRFENFGVEWDRSGNRLIIPENGKTVLLVDLDTGTRSKFVDSATVFPRFSMLKLLPEQNSLLIPNEYSSSIFKASLETGTFSVLTDDSSPNSNVDIDSPYSMELGHDGALYVADAGARFYSVNMDTGARSLISDASRPDGGVNPFTKPTGIVLDEPNNRALIADAATQQLLWVDLTSGARTVWLNSDQLGFPFDIKMDAGDNRIILVDKDIEEILAVDLDSGALTTLSGIDKPANSANSLQIPWGIVIDEETDIAFVGTQSKKDEYHAAIIMVDLTTGERIIVSRSILE
ncbi:hypothetical protein SAMN02745866_01964 [Alteromonadaceae bacterium Bs31]|nr:hypothetical protein SAMN02745866_01964 [Alteromonadaceae bacterium Bs31]